MSDRERGAAPAALLTAEVEAEVRRVIGALEPAFAQIDPAYPVGCCVSACLALTDFLDLHLAENHLVTVEQWLGFRDYDDGVHGDVHQWLVIDGAIVDPTAGQFYGDSERPWLRIYRPGDVGFDAYHPTERVSPPEEGG